MTRGFELGLVALAIVASGCDNRETFHEPDPGLERMLVQPRAEPYGAKPAFADGRAMRPPVSGTVPLEHQRLGERPIETGRDAQGYLTAIPVPVTRAGLEAGRVAFERVCAACHGVLGDGNSIVAEKMELRKPPSLHEARIARLAPGKIFEVTSVGYGLMPSIAAQLGVEQRWAVVGYLEALRLSRAIPVARLPDPLRAELRAGGAMMRARPWLRSALAAVALGVVGSAIGLSASPLAAAFAYLAAFGFVASTLLGALALLAMTHAVSARWFVVLRRSCLSLVAPVPLLPLLFLPVALLLRFVYPWAGCPLASAESMADSRHAVLFGRVWMSAFPFLMRAGIYLLLWIAIAEALRRAAQAQASQPESWLSSHRSAIGAVALPVLGLSGSWASFDWLMSAVPGWNMTSVGLYVLSGGFACALGVLSVLVHWGRRSGALPSAVGAAHSLALGRLLFASVCLWAYIAVSQLIIVWIADLPREAAFYVPRATGGWRYVAGLLVFGHFVVPFLLLLSRSWKERSGFIAAVGGWLVLMHACDMYWLIVPSAQHGPALLDLGPFIVLGALAASTAIVRARALPLVPMNDPDLARSLGYESP